MKIRVVEEETDMKRLDQQAAIYARGFEDDSELSEFEIVNRLTDPGCWSPPKWGAKPLDRIVFYGGGEGMWLQGAMPEALHHSLYEHFTIALEPSGSPTVKPHQENDVESTFHALAEEWRDATEFTSSFTNMILHSAYQKIIGLGPAVVPVLLRELHHSPDHWFWALRHITRENPVAEEDAGNLDRMSEAWLEWGRQNGYLFDDA